MLIHAHTHINMWAQGILQIHLFRSDLSFAPLSYFTETVGCACCYIPTVCSPALLRAFVFEKLHSGQLFEDGGD